MLRRIARWFLVALAVAGAAAAVVVEVIRLDDAGFCFSQRRFLSDNEKIMAAVNYARWRFHVSFRVNRPDGTGAEIMVRTPVYGSAWDFMAANPGCCRMANSGSPPGLFHPEWEDRKLRRPERNVVVVDMAVPFTGPDREPLTATFRTAIALTPCGYAIPRQLLKRIAGLARASTFG